jgi:NhaA family Na+:H+ antiporter
VPGSLVGDWIADPEDPMTTPDPMAAPGGRGHLLRRVARPIRAFAEVEAAAGIVLAVATVVAVAWASSPWSAGYRDLVATEVAARSSASPAEALSGT